MPELRALGRTAQLVTGSNLLDALLTLGVAVPWSCRAGSCQACLVRCEAGEPADAQPDALPAAMREQGWRLACQCRVIDDLHVRPFDPALDAASARVVSLHWLAGDVLALRLMPERSVHYSAGQHVPLWLAGVARPYSFASLAQVDPWIEFHIGCRHNGAFATAAKTLKVGDSISLGQVSGGALHYDPSWSGRPLWLFAAGTGLAPLWAVLREAIAQGHEGPIRVMHLAREAYWQGELQALQVQHPALAVECVTALPSGLRADRRTIALVCGSPQSVEVFGKALFMAGVPRSQVLVERFLVRGDGAAEL
ncbi:iron-sulfur-binding ferredoxin reductase [Pseudomonas sp. KNUC1026]|uniref:iron-sulfur-binding ferredoxin reductase n=1 Tax=Pseudomonas sp. KNUC1026 TaxID=2893890 RepID=UPI001F18D741|nr:iron-sulfur-binding ferredoxin reductase [Pseudomonas sp. KNUC1026]UFH50043.1 iron-sulfur-binding ferredoxin reductase [Pseudomonas sp. KNUC1026]